MKKNEKEIKELCKTLIFSVLPHLTSFKPLILRGLDVYVLCFIIVLSISMTKVQKNPKTPKESQEKLNLSPYLYLSQPIGIFSFKGYTI